MKHLGTKTIETSRLILRRFALEDAPAMHANWASDPEVTKFLTWPPHASVDVSRMVLDGWVKAYDDPHTYLWAIVPKELDQPIGSISVVGQNEKIAGILKAITTVERFMMITMTLNAEAKAMLKTLIRETLAKTVDVTELAAKYRV